MGAGHQGTQGTIEEAFQLAAANGMLQLADSLGFDLADAFASDFEDAAYFFEGIGIPIAQTVTEFDDLPFTVGQRLEDVFDLLLQHLLVGGAGG